MIKLNEHSLFSIGAQPISIEQPCGVNIRYETEFEQLEAELAKQESLNAETVDWEVVAKLASEIIQNSSKDLLVGSYLCYGLLVKEGYSGLSVGLTIMNDMVTEHWECLFPPAKRMRARQTAFTWFAEKAGLYVSANNPAANESEAVIEAANILKALDGALVDKMGDQAPMLSELSRPLKNHKQSAEAELAKTEAAKPAVVNTPDPAPQAQASTSEAAAEIDSKPVTENTPAPVIAAERPAPVASKPSPAISAPPEAGALASDADSKKILRQLQTTARDIANFWISQKLTDPRPYRVARVAAFMVVESAPPDNNGVTQINPPTPERLKFFEAQQGKDDFVNLIPELEKTLARSPFWLDGQFQVVKSLRALGAEYETAAQTVIRELNNFLSRLPEVIGLSFSNDLPFANDQTRMWLDAEVLGQSGSSEGEAAAGSAGELWSSALIEAKQLAASGDMDKALALMNSGMSAASQLRDQVYWRCAIADLLIQTGKSDTAASILEQAAQQVKAMQLSEWEPLLLAKIYTLLFQSYQKQQKTNKEDKSLMEKADLAYEQLCWFDPVTALSLTGG
ncbi:MAG: type VI secretion system protein VasJ [Gammaproteobacteria bacterium]